MTDVARLTTTPPGVRLCALDELADPGARGFVLQMRAGRFHGFAVRQSKRVFGYVDACPHAGVTLACTIDDYLTPNGDLIACGWHGAIFRPESGLCVGGPCSGQSLRPWPLRVTEGAVETG